MVWWHRILREPLTRGGLMAGILDLKKPGAIFTLEEWWTPTNPILEKQTFFLEMGLVKQKSF